MRKKDQREENTIDKKRKGRERKKKEAKREFVTFEMVNYATVPDGKDNGKHMQKQMEKQKQKLKKRENYSRHTTTKATQNPNLNNISCWTDKEISNNTFFCTEYPPCRHF